jgi:hypothetical protein
MSHKPSEKHPKRYPKRKQGYYARRFNAAEIQDLQTDTTGSLKDEIELMRVLIRRLFDITCEEAATLDDWIKVVGTLGSAASRLARMLVVNRQLESGDDPVREIKDALELFLGKVKPEKDMSENHDI